MTQHVPTRPGTVVGQRSSPSLKSQTLSPHHPTTRPGTAVGTRGSPIQTSQTSIHESRNKFDGILNCVLCAHLFANYLALDEFHAIKKTNIVPMKSPLARILRNEDWIEKNKTAISLCKLHTDYKDYCDVLTHSRNAALNQIRLDNLSKEKGSKQPEVDSFIKALERFIMEKFDNMIKLVRQGLIRDAHSLQQRWNTRVDRVMEVCQEKILRTAEQQNKILEQKQTSLKLEFDQRRIHYSAPLLEAFEEEPKMQSLGDFEKLQKVYALGKELEQENRHKFHDELMDEKQKKEKSFVAQKERIMSSVQDKLGRKQALSLQTTQQASEKLQIRVKVALKRLEKEQRAEWMQLKGMFNEHLTRLAHFAQRCGTLTVDRTPLYHSPKRTSFKTPVQNPPVVRGTIMEFATSVLKGEMRVLEHKRSAENSASCKPRPPPSAELRRNVIQNIKRNGCQVPEHFDFTNLSSTALNQNDGPPPSLSLKRPQSSPAVRSSPFIAQNTVTPRSPVSQLNGSSTQSPSPGRIRPQTAARSRPDSPGSQVTRTFSPHKMSRPNTGGTKHPSTATTRTGSTPKHTSRPTTPGTENGAWRSLGAKKTNQQLSQSNFVSRGQPRVYERTFSRPILGGREDEEEDIRPCDFCSGPPFSDGQTPFRLFPDEGRTEHSFSIASCCSMECLLQWNDVFSPPFLRGQRREVILLNYSTEFRKKKFEPEPASFYDGDITNRYG